MKDETAPAFHPMTLASLRASISADGPQVAAARLADRVSRDRLGTVIASDVTPPALVDGPLAGVAIGVKDNIDVLGFATTGGSAALKDNLPGADAPVVARLRAAGAWFPLKLNMHELAFGVTSNNGSYGLVRNPFDPERSAGGSSGGSGTAVASGLVPVALGTDTGASVRIPASFCGVTGFRPSTGRYPAGGVLLLSPTRDTIGVLGATLSDVTEIDSVIAPEDAVDITHPDRPLRLGLPADALPGYCPAVEDRFRTVLARLQAQGVVELVALPALGYADVEAEIGFPLVFGEAVAFWTEFCETRLGIGLDDFAARLESPDVRAVFENLPDLAAQTAERKEEVLHWRRAALQAAFGALFGRFGIDLVVAPTSPVQPPRPEDFADIDVGGRRMDTMAAVTQTVAYATLAGTPSISLPIGLDADGLPVGLLLDGPIGSDRSLLAWAARVEAALG